MNTKNSTCNNNSNIEYIEIQPEYVYVTIPAEYVCIYHKILVMFVDFGIDLLKDCSASCNSRNKKLIDCFNMFNSAIAARQLKQDKLANVLIEYIKAQIELIYIKEPPYPEVVFPVDEEGKIKAIVGCGNKPKFEVDIETGELWAEYKGAIISKYKLGDEDYLNEESASNNECK